MATKINTIATANLATRKAILKAKREQLLGALTDRQEILVEALADQADRMRSYTDRDVAVQRLDHESRLIHDIEQALDRLERNVYGSCEMCESPISSKRLDALPWARLCFACQSEAEAAERFPSPELEQAA
jgi:DnaK suppressor protein